ncbi:MAG: cyclic nucleotide-binding domain-containing protein [Alphaproteobacteria bacterium]|nr:cyclic nucleotide-binding domain-containing protein [Alphaproteobacteria bacterium]
MDFGKDYERKTIPAGANIFITGDRALEAYVLLKGEVDIVGVNDKGDTIVLTTVKRGEMFGELALMTTDSKRSASAISKTECQVMVIKNTLLKDKLDRADPFLKYWVKYLGDRVVDLSKRVQR